MKSDINLTGIIRGFVAFFRRFHTLIFFLVVSGGLFVAILMLLSIISLSASTATSSDQVINATFDEATIQRIELGSSPSVPSGARKNPFVE